MKHSAAVAEWWKTWRKAVPHHQHDNVTQPTQSQKQYPLTELLLLQREEDSVDEFNIFKSVVDQVVKFEPLEYQPHDDQLHQSMDIRDLKATHRGPSALSTNRVENPMLPDDGGNLFDHEDEQYARAKRQEDIMNLEERVELLGWAILHQRLDAEYGRQVRDEGGGDGSPGGERSDTRFPARVRFW